MAVNVMMRWDGVETAPQELSVDGQLQRPEQCLYHRALQGPGSLQVTQTWRTAEAFDLFLRTVLRPALAEVGVLAEPQVVAFQIPDLFFPRALPVLPQQRTASG